MYSLVLVICNRYRGCSACPSGESLTKHGRKSMRKKFKLQCNSTNSKHTSFTLFDPAGVNCGTIRVLTSDVRDFISYDNWSGTVFWCGHLPHLDQSDISQLTE